MFGAALVIEDDHLVLPLMHPLGRHKEALLRADLPIAPDVAPIHPNQPVAPAAHIEISVSESLQIEVAAVKQRSCFRSRREFQLRDIGKRKRENLPAVQSLVIQR